MFLRPDEFSRGNIPAPATGVAYSLPFSQERLTDLTKMREVYNDAWENNWGFVPMTDAETEFMAEGLVFVVEAQNEPTAFLLTVLDYNQAFQRLKGRLLSPKLPGLVPYLLKKESDDGAHHDFGVKKKFRRVGIESVMLAHALKYCLQAGHLAIEVSWILESCGPSLRMLS